jgi:hypothetical protein
MISRLRLPSSAALMIIACHKRKVVMPSLPRTHRGDLLDCGWRCGTRVLIESMEDGTL